jgi:hypothetical protein
MEDCAQSNKSDMSAWTGTLPMNLKVRGITRIERRLLSSPRESHPEALPEPVREPLDSYGSYGRNRIMLPFPQGEQVWLAVDYPNQPCHERVR